MKRNITQMFKEIRDSQSEIRGSQSEIREQLTAIQSGLSEVLEHLQNLDMLAEKRERDRLRKRRVRGQKNVRGQKEQEKGKEKAPPDPLKEKRAKEEEKVLSLTCARDEKRLFEKFWKAYPECGSRKRHPKLCRAEFYRILEADPDPKSLFSRIMASLAKWCETREWKEGCVQTPLNWLYERYWEVDVKPDNRRKIEWVDPKVAAFERQQAENERRDREVNAMLDRMVAERSKLIAGDVS